MISMPVKATNLIMIHQDLNSCSWLSKAEIVSISMQI